MTQRLLTNRDTETCLSPVELLGHVELARFGCTNKLAADPEKRARLGQFFTPSSIAEFMASMMGLERRESVRILDAGAGIGTLTAAAVANLANRINSPSVIVAEAWEVDPDLREGLNATMRLCAGVCAGRGIEFQARVRTSEFISDAVDRLSSRELFQVENSGFDLAILNPPYRKLRSDTSDRRLLRTVGIETSNLYSAFLWLAVELLDNGGELVAITPRSYMNGTYFRPFRRRLSDQTSIRRVHVYGSRNKAFADDSVLQENAIIHTVKGGKPTQVQITASDGPRDSALVTRVMHPHALIHPSDPECVLHVVSDGTDAKIGHQMRALPHGLDDLGVSVSTGRVVEFRCKSRLLETQTTGAVPLVYPRHLRAGEVEWPGRGRGKPNAILPECPDDPLLFPRGRYVLVKRFSAKEEKRRVVAAVYEPDRVGAEVVGFDNKLNVLHRRGGSLSAELAWGLAVYLNSTFVDAYFRQFSGHTQVNAGDLRSLRFPSAEELCAIGGRVCGSMPNQEDVNRLLLEGISCMSEHDDPIAAKQRVIDALEILKAINTPRAQQNERSALALLGLLDLTPGKGWPEATAPLRGVTELMDWMAAQYGKNYAPNTRETIRRFSLHQFIEMGLLLINPDEPGRPPNSPNTVYRLEPSALTLCAAYGTDGWGKALSAYLASVEGVNRLRAKPRQMERIPVRLPEGAVVELSAGGQNVLIKEIVEEFAPRFTPNGRVLYLGDAGEKHLLNDTEYLAGLGVEIDPHGKMPDVVIHDVDRNWLVLVEAVTSHGPVSILRHNQLKDLFAGSKSGLVFVTAFLDRETMREYLPDIAWETEVWIANDPAHLIHFNGTKFLGPYVD